MNKSIHIISLLQEGIEYLKYVEEERELERKMEWAEKAMNLLGKAHGQMVYIYPKAKEAVLVSGEKELLVVANLGLSRLEETIDLIGTKRERADAMMLACATVWLAYHMSKNLRKTYCAEYWRGILTLKGTKK